MKTKTKQIINTIVKSMFVCSSFLLLISFCLFCAKLGFGIKLEPPFCWASFLQMGLFMLGGWAFNKELFYY